MIDLFTANTPNGWKASITLEELALPYSVHPIDLQQGDQKSPAFLRINPNGRIPAIIDHDLGGLTLFESGAIMIHLAEKTGRLLPAEPVARGRVIQWLMFQVGGVGPMMGQANVFGHYFPEKLPAVIDRYRREARRLFEVLDGHLANHRYLAGEYSIADIANWSWAHTYAYSEIDVSGLNHLTRWVGEIAERPATIRGKAVPAQAEPASRDAIVRMGTAMLMSVTDDDNNT